MLDRCMNRMGRERGRRAVIGIYLDVFGAWEGCHTTRPVRGQKECPDGMRH